MKYTSSNLHVVSSVVFCIYLLSGRSIELTSSEKTLTLEDSSIQKNENFTNTFQNIPIDINQRTCESSKEKYVIGEFAGGLGVCFHSVLNHLLHCEQTNTIPIVYWGPGSLYFSAEGFNNRDNAWEYYFDPASNCKYTKGDSIHHYCENETCGHFSYYDPSTLKRKLAHQLISKYVKPNHIVQSKIDQFYTSYMSGKKNIGIHIRGTDKITEEALVAPERMVEEALKYADENTQFFIATDEKKILDSLISLLDGK